MMAFRVSFHLITVNHFLPFHLSGSRAFVIQEIIILNHVSGRIKEDQLGKEMEKKGAIPTQ